MYKEISKTDLRSGLNSAELKAYTSVQIEDDQDVAEEEISLSTDFIRSFIPNLDKNQAGVPDEIRSISLDIIRYRVINRLGLAINADRRTCYTDALSILREDVQSGKITISSTSSASSYGSKKTIFS